MYGHIYNNKKHTASCVFYDLSIRLRDIKDVALAVLNKVEDKQVRDDYQHYSTLKINQTLQICGAMHNGRLMPKLLNAITMILLEPEINNLPKC